MDKRNQKHLKNNYQHKIERSLLNGTFNPRPGTVEILNVYHDPGCSIFKGGLCDCRPDLVRVVRP